MESNWNLSENIIENCSYSISEYEWGKNWDMIKVKDIKEFIRQIKMQMELTWANNIIINKLAGEKLKC